MTHSHVRKSHERGARMKKEEFRRLLQAIADGWNAKPPM